MIVLGLGSNVGDRAAHLQNTVKALQGFITGLRVSSVYESAALLPDIAPDDWDMLFLNMVVCGNTTFAPLECLHKVKELEQQIGRKQRGHWGPREIDIDILAYGDQVVNDPDLVVPHAALLMRDFAMVPFAELLPDWQYPIRGEHYGRKALDLARVLPSTLVRTHQVITL